MGRGAGVTQVCNEGSWRAAWGEVWCDPGVQRGVLEGSMGRGAGVTQVCERSWRAARGEGQVFPGPPQFLAERTTRWNLLGLRSLTRTMAAGG